ncbi:hypothetical protein HPP92_016813 [Vanilla planifolia]|uniref:Uncharacterized protein n=1 Tax=Vanilla planifolia TaxID=51239 RepID=A0A835QES7_VANPL|nr:hypothetical protein HPP92_016813 [Vanilla planifolia]
MSGHLWLGMVRMEVTLRHGWILMVAYGEQGLLEETTEGSGSRELPFGWRAMRTWEQQEERKDSQLVRKDVGGWVEGFKALVE